MRAISSLFLFVFLMACGNVDRLDTAEIKSKMDNYKIKKVSPAEIMTHLNTQGLELKKQVEALSDVSCDQASKKIDSLAIVFDVALELVDINAIKLPDIDNEKEKLLYEAYLFDYKNGKKAAANSQKIDDATYIYTFGVNETNPSMKCEGMGPNFQYFWKATWTQANLIRSM